MCHFKTSVHSMIQMHRKKFPNLPITIKLIWLSNYVGGKGSISSMYHIKFEIRGTNFDRHYKRSELLAGCRKFESFKVKYLSKSIKFLRS